MAHSRRLMLSGYRVYGGDNLSFGAEERKSDTQMKLRSTAISFDQRSVAR